MTYLLHYPAMVQHTKRVGPNMLCRSVNAVTMTNFITRMLFYDIYWLNYFLAWPCISLFHCAAWILNEYMYV